MQLLHDAALLRSLRRNKKATEKSLVLRNNRTPSKKHGMNDVMRMLTLPMDSEAVRCPKDSSVPTALVSSVRSMQVDFQAGSSSLYTAGFTGMAVSRDPLHAMFLNHHNPTSLTGAFNASFNGVDFSSGKSTNTTTLALIAGKTSGPLVISHFTPTAITTSLFGITEPIYAYKGEDSANYTEGTVNMPYCDDRSWILIPAGANITLANLSANFNTYQIFSIYAYKRGTPSQVTFLSGTTNNLQYTIPASDYYQISYSDGQVPPTATCAVTLSYTISTGFPYFQPLPGLSNNLSRFNMGRILSSSLMVTCMASQFNNAGGIFMAQIPSAAGDVLYLNSPPQLEGLRRHKAMDFKDGGYLFHMPVGIEDFDYIPLTEASTVSSNIAVISLPVMREHDSGWAYIMVSNFVESTTGQFSGSHVLVNAAFAAEYQSEDLCTEVESATVSPSIYEEALFRCQQVPQFHCNPMHWSDIKNALSSVANHGIRGLQMGMKYAPTLLSVLGKAAALLA